MSLFALKDPDQRLRLGRMTLALASAAVLTALCWLFWEWNFFRATSTEFALIFGVFWAINLVWPLLILTGLNRRFRDPSMTLPQATWATIIVMVSLYFIYEMRMVVLMFYLLVMVFGAFRLRLAGFLCISALAIVGYGVVILLVSQRHLEIFNLRVEYVQWFTFAVVMTCFSLMGASLSALRRSHQTQNKRLAEALEDIKRLAVTDELTGAWNRRYIVNILKGQKALAERGGYQFSICYIDLDHFKRINDRYGHSVGDRVLRRVARSMNAELREVDYLARFGGEEFVAVLVRTTLDEALKVADRLCRRVREIDFRRVAQRLEVTISIGAADFLPGDTVDELLHRADQALYRAKARGRDRVAHQASPNASALGAEFVVLAEEKADKGEIPLVTE